MTQQDRESIERNRRLDAMSQLVGRFAHDLSNLLATIVLNLNLIEKKCADPTALGFAASALRAADRGASLAQRMLAFAGRQQLARSPTDLGHLVSRMRDTLVRSAGPDVEVVLRRAEAASASVDADQIEFALASLAENAREAMPRGGHLAIEIANARVAAETSDLAPGDYAVIAVEDTGDGMSEEARERAFEPFFTTKATQEHLGLGLSVVLGIAKQHGGTARLMRVASGGCRIEIHLPCATEPEQAATAGDAAPLGRAPRPKATVLVVDDDPDLRMVAEDGLKSLGCDVLLADCGLAALDILGSGPAVDLLMVDVRMAGMDGLELIERARALRPGLKALIMTGGAEVPQGRGRGATALLRKPFRAADLARSIASLLSGNMHRTQ
jgi:CheY-like chemotaxis protein